jgi:hypothetical protein
MMNRIPARTAATCAPSLAATNFLSVLINFGKEFPEYEKARHQTMQLMRRMQSVRGTLTIPITEWWQPRLISCNFEAYIGIYQHILKFNL